LIAGVATVAALAMILANVVQAQSTTGSGAGSGQFQFTPLASSSPCTPGGNAARPFLLPPGYDQRVFASEPQFPDLPDMNTQNETGPDAGRYVYRTHETNANAAVSVTDLETNATRILAQRQDWERFDGIEWTPWGTILAAEETSSAAFKDPAVPQAEAVWCTR